ncbi:hypothetical protein HY636_05765 [Candidatus Woesearchaeota archaeon]|nr:hypothetical protein [Candidatus Woesearchaeota archaeon]
MNKELIPSDLDFVLLEDLDGFYQRLTEEPLGFLSSCRGLYIAKDHTWILDEHYTRISEALKKEYGIEVQRALLLSQEMINYWTMIHEALHDVFNHLPPEQREKIIQSATCQYDTSDKLHRMLDMTHLNISNFDWNLDENAKIIDENKRLGRSPLDRFNHFYTFGNLKPVDQLQAVDEFISNFYANYRGNDRWSERHLQPKFRKTLEEVGYNMSNPPEVKY